MPAMKKEPIPEKIREWIISHANKNVPDYYREAYLKVSLNATNNRRMIRRINCCECVGFEEVYKGVGECKSYACPRWSRRPYQDRFKEV